MTLAAIIVLLLVMLGSTPFVDAAVANHMNHLLAFLLLTDVAVGFAIVMLLGAK